MTRQTPVYLNYTQEREILKLVPIANLLLSKKIGGDTIGLDYFVRSAGYEVPTHSCVQHGIIVSLSQVERTERRIDGQHRLENQSIGDVALIPVQTPHWTVDAQDSESILLTLTPELVTSSVVDVMNPDHLELMPTFAQPDPLIYGMSLALRSELSSVGEGNRLYLDAIAHLLCVHLVRHYSTQLPRVRDYQGGLSRFVLEQVIEYIQANLERDISVAELANLAQMSPYYFSRLFKQSMNMAPHQYLIQCRLEEVRRLLRTTDLPIAEIAERTGFSSHSHLTTQFKKQFSVTPRTYREQL